MGFITRKIQENLINRKQRLIPGTGERCGKDPSRTKV